MMYAQEENSCVTKKEKRSSILKMTRSPGPALEDIDPNAQNSKETTKRSKNSRRSSSRRVSFAETCQIKEIPNEVSKRMSTWDQLQMDENTPVFLVSEFTSTCEDSSYRPPASTLAGLTSLLSSPIQDSPQKQRFHQRVSTQGNELDFTRCHGGNIVGMQYNAVDDDFTVNQMEMTMVSEMTTKQSVKNNQTLERFECLPDQGDNLDFTRCHRGIINAVQHKNVDENDHDQMDITMMTSGSTPGLDMNNNLQRFEVKLPASIVGEEQSLTKPPPKLKASILLNELKALSQTPVSTTSRNNQGFQSFERVPTQEKELDFTRCYGTNIVGMPYNTVNDDFTANQMELTMMSPTSATQTVNKNKTFERFECLPDQGDNLDFTRCHRDNNDVVLHENDQMDITTMTTCSSPELDTNKNLQRFEIKLPASVAGDGQSLTKPPPKLKASVLLNELKARSKTSLSPTSRNDQGFQSFELRNSSMVAERPSAKNFGGTKIRATAFLNELKAKTNHQERTPQLGTDFGSTRCYGSNIDAAQYKAVDEDNTANQTEMTMVTSNFGQEKTLSTSQLFTEKGTDLDFTRCHGRNIETTQYKAVDDDITGNQMEMTMVSSKIGQEKLRSTSQLFSEKGTDLDLARGLGGNIETTQYNAVDDDITGNQMEMTMVTSNIGQEKIRSTSQLFTEKGTDLDLTRCHGGNTEATQYKAVDDDITGNQMEMTMVTSNLGQEKILSTSQHFPEKGAGLDLTRCYGGNIEATQYKAVDDDITGNQMEMTMVTSNIGQEKIRSTSQLFPEKGTDLDLTRCHGGNVEGTQNKAVNDDITGNQMEMTMVASHRKTPKARYDNKENQVPDGDDDNQMDMTMVVSHSTALTERYSSIDDKENRAVNKETARNQMEMSRSCEQWELEKLSADTSHSGTSNVYTNQNVEHFEEGLPEQGSKLDVTRSLEDYTDALVNQTENEDSTNNQMETTKTYEQLEFEQSSTTIPTSTACTKTDNKNTEQTLTEEELPSSSCEEKSAQTANLSNISATLSFQIDNHRDTDNKLSVKDATTNLCKEEIEATISLSDADQQDIALKETQNVLTQHSLDIVSSQLVVKRNLSVISEESAVDQTMREKEHKKVDEKENVIAFDKDQKDHDFLPLCSKKRPLCDKTDQFEVSCLSSSKMFKGDTKIFDTEPRSDVSHKNMSTRKCQVSADQDIEKQDLLQFTPMASTFDFAQSQLTAYTDGVSTQATLGHQDGNQNDCKNSNVGNDSHVEVPYSVQEFKDLAYVSFMKPSTKRSETPAVMADVPTELKDKIYAKCLYEAKFHVWDNFSKQREAEIAENERLLYVKEQQLNKANPAIFAELKRALATGTEDAVFEKLESLKRACHSQAYAMWYKKRSEMDEQILSSLKVQKDRLTHDLSILKDRENELDEDSIMLDKVSEELDEKIRSLELTLESEEKEWDDFNKESEEFRKQLEGLELDLQTKEEEREKLANEKDTLTSDITEKKNIRAELECSIQQQSDELVRLEAKMEEIDKKLPVLKALQEWVRKEHNKNHTKYTFLSDTYDLDVFYEDSEDYWKAKTKDITLVSHLSDRSIPLAKLGHRLIQERFAGYDFKARFPTRGRSPELLHVVSEAMVRVRAVLENVQRISIDHIVQLNDKVLTVEFSSLRNFLKFELNFDLSNLVTDGILPYKVVRKIGKISSDTIASQLSHITPNIFCFVKILRAADKILSSPSA